MKQLEQELLDTRDGADEDKLLPVGKLQVHFSSPFFVGLLFKQNFFAFHDIFCFLVICEVQLYHFQASAEEFEDRLKGLLDRADSINSDQTATDQAGADDNRPVRKRRKLNNPVVGDYNQEYDEVLVVDEGENEPEEELAEAKEEQFEEIDPKDISR